VQAATNQHVQHVVENKALHLRESLAWFVEYPCGEVVRVKLHSGVVRGMEVLLAR
jgi:nitrous oxidase accessory protein NosD